MILLPQTDKGPLMSPNDQEPNELDVIFWDPGLNRFTLDFVKPSVVEIPSKWVEEATLIYLNNLDNSGLSKELKIFLTKANENWAQKMADYYSGEMRNPLGRRNPPGRRDAWA
jgi:hypothetical protein